MTDEELAAEYNRVYDAFRDDNLDMELQQADDSAHTRALRAVYRLAGE